MSSEHTASTPPSPWVARFCSGVPAGARVLDFASGAGRHAGLLVGRAVHYLALDADAAALARLRDLHGAGFHAAGGSLSVARTDLETGPWPVPREAFDLVIVSNFLHRPRLSLLGGLLAPGGLLIYETFAEGQERIGRPRRAAFLLRPGELLGVCARAGFHVLAYEDGLVGRSPGGPDGAPPSARRQRLCAVRPPVDWERYLIEAAPRLTYEV